MIFDTSCDSPIYNLHYYIDRDLAMVSSDPNWLDLEIPKQEVVIYTLQQNAELLYLTGSQGSNTRANESAKSLHFYEFKLLGRDSTQQGLERWQNSCAIPHFPLALSFSSPS